MSDPRAIDCAGVMASIEDYLEDRLAPADKAAVRAHVHSCPACFERVVDRDPIQLFAPLAGDSPGADRPGFWDGFWPGIRDSIDGAAARRRTWLRAAAAILAVAGAAAILALLPGLMDRGKGDAPVEPPEVVAAAEPLPPTVERVVSPDSGDVQIYSMTYYQDPETSGAAPEATELILIVDAGLDL